MSRDLARVQKEGPAFGIGWLEMSQRGGFRGGRFKGRDRNSPYSRGGGGGAYRKRNGGVKGEADRSFQDATPSVVPPSEDSVARAEQSVAMGTPHQENVGPSPSHTHSESDHASSQGSGDVGDGAKAKKYSVKARLFVGNLPKDTSQDVVKEMFQQFGEVREAFVQREKNFGFIRMVSSMFGMEGWWGLCLVSDQCPSMPVYSC